MLTSKNAEDLKILEEHEKRMKLRSDINKLVGDALGCVTNADIFAELEFAKLQLSGFVSCQTYERAEAAKKKEGK